MPFSENKAEQYSLRKAKDTQEHPSVVLKGQWEEVKGLWEGAVLVIGSQRSLTVVQKQRQLISSRVLGKAVEMKRILRE